MVTLQNPTTATGPYPKLLSPYRFGRFTLKNRVLMNSMHTGLEHDTARFDRLTEYYVERAKGGVGLIVTGGVSPNQDGATVPGGGKLTTPVELEAHRKMVSAVHAAAPDCKIVMQILHVGAYTRQKYGMTASGIGRPNSKTIPVAMTEDDILRTIRDFVRCAELCKEAGYDGIELKTSGGYLLNSFIAPLTNKRTDKWGGSAENRRRLSMEILRQTREAVGPDFMIIYRQTALELVSDGSTFEEIVEIAQEAERLGADMISTHVGWHQARVPTIASFVPNAAWVDFIAQLKPHISIPLVTTNRINDPATAEAILQDGKGDIIAMARPLLADAAFVNKAAAGRADEINTCIACNQGCMDYVFDGHPATCLVNPRAARETEIVVRPAATPKRIAVIGGGPAGLAAATTAAERGHQVTLYEGSAQLGGQFNTAMRIPGKEEYGETIRYFSARLASLGVTVKLGKRMNDMAALRSEYDEVILATGVTPRVPQIEGVDHPKVISYLDALHDLKPVGKSVAIIGAGGIGFDTAEYLSHNHDEEPTQEQFFKDWGVDPNFTARGGLLQATPPELTSPRTIYLMQRKDEKLGTNLGKTTGWIHRSVIRRKGVNLMAGCTYLRVDDAGLHYSQGGEAHVLEVDTVVLCAGQVSDRSLLGGQDMPNNVHLIGGADKAGELDALRAIRQGTLLAAEL
jgi:2,4-dienoyl-CoA reductase (NADPH2)